MYKSSQDWSKGEEQSRIKDVPEKIMYKLFLTDEGFIFSGKLRQYMVWMGPPSILLDS